MTARLESLQRAVARFGEALEAPETDMNRDATIQRFEFCFELAWKTIQGRAREEGLDCQSPKECLRVAFRMGWLDDESNWLAMLDDSNRTSHTYDERFAHQLYGRLPDYLPLLQSLTERLHSDVS